jgi:PKD repeat protein
MKTIKLLVASLFIFTSLTISAQMIVDFETPETTPVFSAEGETSVVDNPDANGINSSAKVGYYKKVVGEWKYVTMDFPDTMQIAYNNTLTFKLRTSTQGRIFAKFWIGDEILIESWAPTYDFQPLADTWTECKMDLTPAMGKAFTKLELAACVDNNDTEADVYFDDVLLSNPDVGDGTPKATFTVSSNKVFIGDEVTFDASGSFDFDGEITDYSWDFGDGSVATGEIVKHTYTSDSIYNVNLTLTDNDAKTSTDNKYIFVLDENEKISKATFVNTAPAINEKIEAVFQINKSYTNVYNPDEVTVDAEILYPDGSIIMLPCFYYVSVNLENTTWVKDTTYQSWMLRFISEQQGTHSVKLILNDADGKVTSDTYFVEVTDGAAKGIIRNDTKNKQYYRHTTGEPFYPLGINIGWNSIANYTAIIDNLSAAKANTFRYWHTPFAQQALEWKPTSFYDGLGVYSQEAAAMSDQLLDHCEGKNMYMQLTIFQHGMFSENVDSMWVDNPYNTVNGGYIDRAEEYFYNDASKVQTKKLLRYIVARWAYSKNLFAWEFFNEVQFTGIHNEQTSRWFPGVLTWHSEMSQYIQSIDPFNHIMTTVAEHDQIPHFDSISALDNIQYHLYSNNMLADQVKLDNNFKVELENLSIINGEYGTNNEADVPFDMQRHSIWNGIMTQVPGYMWIWEHYLDLSWAGLFTMPADYISDEDFAKEGVLENYLFDVKHATKQLKSYGLTSGINYYGYIYDEFNGVNISGAECQLKNLPFANYTVTYYLPESNEIIKVDSLPLVKLTNILELPDFSKSIAFKIKYHSKYTLPVAIAGNDTIIAPELTVSFSGALSFSQVTDATLSYLWSIEENPNNSNLTIADATAMDIDVVPDVSGIYKLSLVVNDGFNNSMPDVVQITVSNVPIAMAGNDTIVSIEDRYFFFDGSNSYDPDGDELSFKWQLIEWPEESRANLLDFTKPNAILEVDEMGVYKAVLVVNDGISDSKPDTIMVNVLTTDIEQSNFSNVKIYPNPTNVAVHIISDGDIDKVEIFDISGRKMLAKNIEDNRKIFINLGELSSQNSLFIIKLSNNEKAVYRKVVVNK